MGKIDFIRDHWHILLISFGIIAFSLLSWIGTVKTCMPTVISYFEETAESVEADLPPQSEDVGAADPGENPALVFADKVTDFAAACFEEGMRGKVFLSRFDSVFTYFALGEVISRQVLLGEENWLFYKSTSDGDSIADFEGTNRYSEDEMQAIINTAAQTQAIIENKGIRFTFMVAPNKENIYSEYMPDIYHHADVSSTDILIDRMIQNHVNIISPKEQLLENHLKHQLYYSYDTHWNQLGAYIGVKEVLASWGIDMPDLAEREIISKELKGNYHSSAGDDLAAMIGLRSIFDDEIEYEIAGTRSMDWTAFAAEEGNGTVSHYSDPNADVDGTILLVGDSFRTSMIPSLREIFSEVYVVQRSNYTPQLLDEIEPDYLIAEYVERYSNQIGQL